MTYPIITALTGSIVIIFPQILFLNTGLHRTSTGIGVGHGDDQNLQRKSRRHGNLAENSAIFLLLLALLELRVATAEPVLIAASTFVAARVFHAISFASLAGSHTNGQGSGIFVILRALGAFGTVLSGIGVGVYPTYLLLADMQITP